MPHSRGTAVLTSVGFVLLAGCADSRAGSATEDTDFPMTIQNCNREVTIQARPERVITNGLDALNLVATAGGADLVVARASEFGQELRGPAREATEVELLDADHDLSTEAIIDSGAQLMITNPDYLAASEVTDQISQAGIATVFPSGYCDPTGPDDAPTFEDVYADLELFGRLFGTEERAAQAVADLRERVSEFESGQPVGAQRSAAEVQVYDNVVYAVGAGSIENTQLETLGLRNVFADATEQFIEPSLEELIARDPEVLILQYGFAVDDGALKSFEEARLEFLALPGVADMRAVRDGAVVGILVAETAADPQAVDGLATIDAALRTLR